jgi:hypothetical protein
MPHPLDTYLRELHDIRSTGAAQREPSFYPALAKTSGTNVKVPFRSS